ncbi:hypothetical protein K8I28_11955 [bacterium]|nr:hypothetical protein [bacterium]
MKKVFSHPTSNYLLTYNQKTVYGVVFYCLFILLQFAPNPAFSTLIQVVDNRAIVEYGDHNRGDHFQDTLTFFQDSESERILIRPIDAEVTCDCITVDVRPDSSKTYPNGYLLLNFDVLQEEPDGLCEKIVYVFHDGEESDLFRLTVTVNVLPGGEKPSQSSSNKLTSPPKKDTNFSEQYSSISRIYSPSDALKILFFYSPGCQSCQRVKDIVLPELTNKYAEKIDIIQISIDETDGYALLLAMREQYGVSNRHSPFTMFIGEEAIQGRKDLFERADRAVQVSLTNRIQTIIPQMKESSEIKTRRAFQSFSFWAVLGAGLIDGLNPCAFATIVFFISLLGYAGSTKRQMMIVGIGFTISVFAVYLLLGLGAFRALQALSIYGFISKSIYFLTFLLLVILFVLALRDTIRYYQTGGRTDDQILQLGKKTKRRIHSVMRKGIKTQNLLLGAISIGALVSLFEAACTGQVYLPTIVLMLNDPILSGNALLYLVLYNVMFITPLIVVFLLAYFGVASERFAEWSREHFGVTRIALTGLFLLLGILMAYEWLQI